MTISCKSKGLTSKRKLVIPKQLLGSHPDQHPKASPTWEEPGAQSRQWALNISADHLNTCAVKTVVATLAQEIWTATCDKPYALIQMTRSGPFKVYLTLTYFKWNDKTTGICLKNLQEKERGKKRENMWRLYGARLTNDVDCWSGVTATWGFTILRSLPRGWTGFFGTLMENRVNVTNVNTQIQSHRMSLNQSLQLGWELQCMQ